LYADLDLPQLPEQGDTSGGGGAAGSGGDGGSTPVNCGDGNIDAPNEECDDGDENGPGKACNAQCKANVCGDGDKGPDEACDDGANPPLVVGACAPDCSQSIVKKQIALSTSFGTGGDLGANPVGFADALCLNGYKAMFAFDLVRRATTSPNASVEPIDWPVSAYTYYYNANDEPVFVTDDVPLIGIRNGSFESLETAVSPISEFVLTGVNTDYTTLTADNCNGWGSVTGDTVAGFAFETGTGFINTDQTVPVCDDGFSFYCVEL